LSKAFIYKVLNILILILINRVNLIWGYNNILSKLSNLPNLYFTIMLNYNKYIKALIKYRLRLFSKEEVRLI